MAYLRRLLTRPRGFRRSDLRASTLTVPHFSAFPR